MVSLYAPGVSSTDGVELQLLPFGLDTLEAVPSH